MSNILTQLNRKRLVVAVVGGPPSIPTDILSTFWKLSGVTISWTASTGGTGLITYQVYSATSYDGIYTEWETPTTNTAKSAIIPIDTFIYFKVKAYDSNNVYSDFSAYTVFCTDGAGGPCFTP